MKKGITTVLLVIGFVAISVNSVLAFACVGKPHVSMSLQSGTVSANIGYGTWYLCSLNSIEAGITPQACEKIYNGLLLAESLNNKSAIYFPGGAGSCETIGSWKYPDVSHYFIDFLIGPAN